MQIYLTYANIIGREREAYLDAGTKTMTKAWRLTVLFFLFSLFSGLILCVHALYNLCSAGLRLSSPPVLLFSSGFSFLSSLSFVFRSQSPSLCFSSFSVPPALRGFFFFLVFFFLFSLGSVFFFLSVFFRSPVSSALSPAFCWVPPPPNSPVLASYWFPVLTPLWKQRNGNVMEDWLLSSSAARGLSLWPPLFPWEETEEQQFFFFLFSPSFSFSLVCRFFSSLWFLPLLTGSPSLVFITRECHAVAWILMQ